MAQSEQLSPADRLAVFLRGLGAYFFQAIFVAWVGVFLISLFLGAGVAWLNEKVADALFSESIYPGVIVVGLLIGYAVNKFLRSKFVLWLWIVSILPILYDFYCFRHSGWRDTFNYLFLRRNCGECIEPFFTVAPFYGSVAYSLGAWAALKRNSRRF